MGEQKQWKTLLKKNRPRQKRLIFLFFEFKPTPPVLKSHRSDSDHFRLAATTVHGHDTAARHKVLVCIDQPLLLVNVRQQCHELCIQTIHVRGAKDCTAAIDRKGEKGRMRTKNQAERRDERRRKIRKTRERKSHNQQMPKGKREPKRETETTRKKTQKVKRD